MTTVVTSGEIGLTVDAGGWPTLLEVPGNVVVDAIVLDNEGDFPGFWGLLAEDGETKAARLACGSGETGGKSAATTVPCRGFRGGELQIKRGMLGGNLAGLFAWAVKE